jgi:hypothetical protein
VVELTGGDPPDLIGLAQFGQRPVTFTVRYPQVSWREPSGVCTHDRCSLSTRILLVA